MGALRFLLALAVVVSHTGTNPFYSGVGPVIAVQGFFVISGFLIARVWDQKYSKQAGSIRLFYENRVARIFLTYWAILALIVISALLVLAVSGHWPGFVPRDLYVSWQMITLHLVANVSLIGSSVLLWLGASPDGVLYLTDSFGSSPLAVWRLLLIAPAWSLELELWFYVIAPFVLRLRLQWIVGIALATFSARFAWYQLGTSADPWSYRFFPFELGTFLLGAVAYRISAARRFDRRIGLALYVLLIGGLGLYFPAYLSDHRFAFLAMFAAVLPAIFDLTKDWKFDQFLADMSFPLYLVHWPTMFVAALIPAPFKSWPGMLGVVASIALAAILVVLVERPIERWRHANLKARSTDDKAKPALVPYSA